MTDYVTLQTNGRLTVHKSYCWDGASGGAIDSKNVMKASLIHDALYQMIRCGELPKEKRKWADKVFRKICLEEGMSKFRAWYMYRTLRMFGGPAAKPRKPTPTITI